MGFLLLIRVPTPHSQHSLVHLIGSETLLRSVRSHDAQVSIRSTAVGWARRSGAAAAVSLKSVASSVDLGIRTIIGMMHQRRGMHQIIQLI